MKNITCLLIDDDADDHQLFHEAVERISKSIRCFFAFNGKEAIEKLVAFQFKPDLIFLDLRMPLMNGLQFLKEKIKHQMLRDIHVYVLTDYFDDSRLEIFSLGAKDVIAKPFSRVEWENSLISVLRKFHQHSR